MRAHGHSLASTSGRGVVVCRCKTRRLQLHAALLEPPPFEPRKLSVQYLAGARPPNSLSMSVSRRYTLTHNDLTGALNLSIGSDYNSKQIQGFYTRILRDEITAEWYFNPGAAAPAELHIYCHVSGEEKWLAPPQLRNFIFRREMTLVLDTFYYADKEFLRAHPELMQAKVYVHFQSDVQDLDLREYWGTLGDRRSWRRMPQGMLARLRLLLFGFPAAPHQRPRTSLTLQQQQRQRQQQDLVPAAVVAAVASNDAALQQQQQQQQQQWHPLRDTVGQTRSVASSLQDWRRKHQQGTASQQKQPQGSDPQQQGLHEDQLGSALLVSSSCSSTSISNGVRQQPQQQAVDCVSGVSTGVGHCSSQASCSSNGASSNCTSDSIGHSSSVFLPTASGDEGTVPVVINSNGRNTSSCSNHSGSSQHMCDMDYGAAEQLPQQQALQQASWLAAAVAASEQAAQQRGQDILPQRGCKHKSGVHNGAQDNYSSSTALASAVEVDEAVTTFQLVLQQPHMRIMRSAVVAAAGLHTGSTTRSAKNSM